MKKLVKNLIIGIVIAILSFFLIQIFNKQKSQDMYNTYLQNEHKSYSSILVNNTSESNFYHNYPYFALNLPYGLSLEKAIDNNGIIGYVGESDSILCQIQVIDIYTLMNMKSQGYDRKILDYNMYSKSSMNAAYDGLVKSTISNSPYGDVKNVEHSVRKINDRIFIYIKYEIPDEDESMIRKSYNFLINGYQINLYGLFFKIDKEAEIQMNDLLNSINFKWKYRKDYTINKS